MCSNEIWETIPRYQGYYEASNLGRIRSKPRDVTYTKKLHMGQEITVERHFESCLLKPRLTSTGWYTVTVSVGGKYHQPTVHRLVAETFLDNFEDKSYVHHKDEDRSNNCADNLEWVDRSDIL